LLRRAGLIVRQLRQAKKMSMEDLASAAGIHKNTIAAVENRGANLSLLNWDLLAKAVGVTLCQIVDAANSDMDARKQIVDAFRDSPARHFEGVTDEEILWLEMQPLEAILGPNPSPKSVLHLILAHRNNQ
jgi:transcriptional regulator with XRE-family HTH domain